MHVLAVMLAILHFCLGSLERKDRDLARLSARWHVHYRSALTALDVRVPSTLCTVDQSLGQSASLASARMS